MHSWWKTVTKLSGNLPHQHFKRMFKHYRILIIVGLVIFGVGLRLLPHAPNLTPVTALSFVSARYLGRPWAVVLPGVILIISDALIGFYSWKILLSVYGSFALIGLVHMATSKMRSVVVVSAALVTSSVLFFIVTNAAVWAFSPWYEKTLSGLIYSFELGLPFLRNMLLGDFLYTAMLVCVFEVRHRLHQNRHYSSVPSMEYRIQTALPTLLHER